MAVITFPSVTPHADTPTGLAMVFAMMATTIADATGTGAIAVATTT